MDPQSVLARSSRRLVEAAPDWVQRRIRRRHYLRLLRMHHLSEKAVLAALITPGSHVLDLGAHVGWYVRTFAELAGPAGCVHAVEPVPSTFEVLAFGVAQFHLETVTLIQCAIGDRPGDQLMEVPRYGKGWPECAGFENSYGARFATAEGSRRGLRQFPVRVATIDGLAPEGPISLIKMDLEGQEARALEGGREVIARWHPALMIELLHDPVRYPDSMEAGVFGTLAQCGYEGRWWDGNRLQDPESRPEQHFCSDYFFLRPKHRDALRQQGLLLPD
jgi:FkbM family methyltransferase